MGKNPYNLHTDTVVPSACCQELEYQMSIYNNADQALIQVKMNDRGGEFCMCVRSATWMKQPDVCRLPGCEAIAIRGGVMQGPST